MFEAQLLRDQHSKSYRARLLFRLVGRTYGAPLFDQWNESMATTFAFISWAGSNSKVLVFSNGIRRTSYFPPS